MGNAAATSVDVIHANGTGNYLSGKTAIVTGGNSGIGLETCKSLAFAGARVILCSKTIEEGEAALLTWIRDDDKESAASLAIEVEKVSVVVKELDLRSLGSIKSFVEDVRKTESRVDFLVLNAGVMCIPKLEYTEAGFEQTIGVNYIGHFYLVSLMLDTLARQTFNSRIVIVSSMLHDRTPNFDVHDLHYATRKYDPFQAYCDSKLALILFSKELSSRLEGTKVSCAAVHPGIIITNLFRHMSKTSPIYLFVTKLAFVKSKSQGAASTIWACVCSLDTFQKLQGGYIADCAPAKVNSFCCDRVDGKELWTITEDMLEKATSSDVALAVTGQCKITRQNTRSYSTVLDNNYFK